MTKPINKELGTNGCGGAGGMITPPYSIFFETSCNIHDENYNIGGTEEDRKIADLGLLKYMGKDVLKLEWYKQPYFYLWCGLYYLSVRFVGWRYFNYK